MQREGESQPVWDIVGFGENSVDVIAALPALPAPDGKAGLESLNTLPGGQVASAMVGCARLGLRTRYVGSFGDDTQGAWLQARLRDEGVDIAASRVVPGPSRTAVIVVETRTGTRTVLEHRAASLDWPPAELPMAVLSSARLLLVDATDIEASVAACSAARAAGVLTMVDVDHTVPGLAALLRASDIIVTSEALASDRRRLHGEFGARVVIATLGAAGAVAWDGEQDHYSPGFAVPVVDTTGAGDAFRAALILKLLDPRTPGLLDSWTPGPLDPWTPGPLDSWTAVLDFANAAAALNCRARGAQAGLPDRAEVEALLTLAGADRSKRTWGRAHMESQPRAWAPGDPA